ncbi:hypothetical protein ACQBAR_12195 [Propionibacteriaceae bacterium Y1685]|uniref:hypothetical protein n=1 Tax=Microlunatus sp. Y1700 TaxID=3418487 RepID=UPI003B8235C0
MNQAGGIDPTTMTSFALWQQLKFTVNRFEIRAGGKEGPVVAMAQQKRMALKEEVSFYADEAQTHKLFGFKARSVMDLAATYDITDGQGQQIGWFKKDFGASMLRSTWLMGVPHQQLEGRGHERNQVVAILRRFADFSWPIHFDFTAANGAELLSVERGWGLRDAYDCQLPVAPNGARLDWRVAASLAVACDVLMAR